MLKMRITIAITMILIVMMTMPMMIMSIKEIDLGNNDVVQRLAVVARC